MRYCELRVQCNAINEVRLAMGDWEHCAWEAGDDGFPCEKRAPLACGHGIENIRLELHEGYLGGPPLLYRVCVKCEEERDAEAA